jgi:hypothetical protein
MLYIFPKKNHKTDVFSTGFYRSANPPAAPFNLASFSLPTLVLGGSYGTYRYIGSYSEQSNIVRTVQYRYDR